MHSLKVPAKIENLHQMMEFIRSFMEANQINNTAIMQTELAVEEALVNIINYAYPDKNGDMELRCAFSADRKISFDLIDSGLQFDISKMKEPDITKPVEEKPIGGLGIFLLKRMMDDVRYIRENNQNILTLVKQC
jgi:serine/threonine-protein kinase RsbW